MLKHDIDISIYLCVLIRCKTLNITQEMPRRHCKAHWNLLKCANLFKKRPDAASKRIRTPKRHPNPFKKRPDAAPERSRKASDTPEPPQGAPRRLPKTPQKQPGRLSKSASGASEPSQAKKRHFWDELWRILELSGSHFWLIFEAFLASQMRNRWCMLWMMFWSHFGSTFLIYVEWFFYTRNVLSLIIEARSW